MCTGRATPCPYFPHSPGTANMPKQLSCCKQKRPACPDQDWHLDMAPRDIQDKYLALDCVIHAEVATLDCKLRAATGGQMPRRVCAVNYAPA